MGVKDADVGISQARHLKPRPAERGLRRAMDRGGCSLRVRRGTSHRGACAATLRKGEGEAAKEGAAGTTGNEQGMHATAASNSAGEHRTAPEGAGA